MRTLPPCIPGGGCRERNPPPGVTGTDFGYKRHMIRGLWRMTVGFFPLWPGGWRGWGMGSICYLSIIISHHQRLQVSFLESLSSSCFSETQHAKHGKADYTFLIYRRGSLLRGLSGSFQSRAFFSTFSWKLVFPGLYSLFSIFPALILDPGPHHVLYTL